MVCMLLFLFTGYANLNTEITLVSNKTQLEKASNILRT